MIKKLKKGDILFSKKGDKLEIEEIYSNRMITLTGLNKLFYGNFYFKEKDDCYFEIPIKISVLLPGSRAKYIWRHFHNPTKLRKLKLEKIINEGKRNNGKILWSRWF